MKKKEDRKEKPSSNQRIFKIMKITLFLLLAFMIQVKGNVYSQNQMVSLSLKNCTVMELLKEIRKQTGVRFMYKSDYVKSIDPFDVDVKDKKLETLMDEVFAGTDIQCLYHEDVIVLVKRSAVPQSGKQERTIRGKVIDKKGEPMSFASVIIKGTTTGVSTDADGNFTIALPERKEVTLEFRFIGMETKELKLSDIKDAEVLAGKKEITITLVESVESLDDVVVTGYANVRKESFTGNAVRVKGEDILKVSNRNVISALQVFDPSFRIMTNNAMGSNPNAIPEFYIRGHSGIGIRALDATDVSEARLKGNSNLPIFIVDGIDVSVEEVYDMDPNRLHSVTILKDAAATAVYGSRASNGVIVIETVAPKAGKFNFSYNLTGSITAPDLSSYDYFNAAEKLKVEELSGYYELNSEIQSQRVRAAYLEWLKKSSAIAKGVDTYWLSQPLRVGYNHKHSLAIDGGNDNIRYGINFGYDNQKGVMKKDYRDRLSASMRIDYRIDNLSIINRVMFNKVSTKDSPFGSFSSFVGQLPYNELKDAFGNYIFQFPVWHSGSPYVNPMYEGTETQNYSKGSSEQFSDNLNIDWYIKDYLSLKVQMGLSHTIDEAKRFTDPKSGTYTHEDLIRGDLYTTEGKQFSWSTNAQLIYNQAIEKNYISVALGVEVRENQINSSTIHYRGFPSGELSAIMYAQEIVGKPSEVDNHTRDAGAFLRLNYSYNDIYLMDGSVRFDGSSEFGSDKKYAPFWSAGFGLNIHNYAFLKNNSFLTQLKLTATFGQTGKLNFEPYAAKDIYEIFPESWYATGMGVRLKALGNPGLTWEIKDSYDLKAELSIKDGLLYAKAAYYNGITNNMVTEITLPSSFGFNKYYDNLGEIKNVGYELELRSNLINKHDLFLSLYGNMAHNKNKILKISNSLKEYNDRVDAYYEGYSQWTGYQEKWAKPFTKYEEGGSTTSIFGMKSLGIDPASGQEVFVRRDGTITYEWEASEQQILGNSMPKLQGSFGMNFQWKSLNLFMSFMYEWGGQVYNSTYPSRVESVDFYNYNADRRVLTDRWIKIGDIAPLKDIADRKNYSRPTSRFVQDNNWLRFNSMSIAWNFRDGWVERLNLSLVKLQFSMNEVAHWSSVKQERGTDYPFARTFDFTLGVNF